MTRPAVENLRRLRFQLTAVFTVINTVALVIMAPLILVLDEQRRQDHLDAQVDQVTEVVLRLIQSSPIDPSGASADPIATDCPQFVVVPGSAASFAKTASHKDCAPIPDQLIDDLSTKAVSAGEAIVAEGTSTTDRPVRIGVKPFEDKATGQYAGAVVAWVDADQQYDAHQNVVLLVLGGSLLFLVIAAGGGYLIAGRAIRPAATALHQQEVLLAETAHDLRTPVAALRALAETAARDPGQRAELLPRTVRLSARMGDIIDGLLVRARLAAGVEQLSFQPVWLDQLVGGLVEDLPRENATVSVVTAPSKVRADPALLQRAIGNLLDNALRHGREPGGRAVVTVTVANGRVTVADQGPGIDESMSEDLLDRFSSGAGSSGLGLSIVRWVALSHGGSLTVYNADEGGAIFEFALPPE